MEGWMKSDKRGKCMDEIGNVVISDNGWKSDDGEGQVDDSQGIAAI